MFYIPKEDYDKIISKIQNNETITVNFNEYEKYQKDTEFIKNGINIDKIPETIKISLINSEYIISDEFKNELSNTVSQIHLIKFTTPQITFKKYTYAAENIFDIPENMQDKNISELSKKILYDIFSGTKISNSIASDMIERFLSDEASTLTSIKNNFKGNIFKYFLSANLQNEIYDKIYKSDDVSGTWKAIITKLKHNTCHQKEIYLNKELEKFYEGKSIELTEDALIQTMRDIHPNKNISELIINEHIKENNVRDQKWMTSLILSNNIDKNILKRIKKEARNQKVKLLSDVCLRLYDKEQEKFKLTEYIDTQFDKGGYRYKLMTEASKQNAKDIFELLLKIKKSEEKREDYGYLDYIEKKLEFLSIKYDFKFKEEEPITLPNISYNLREISLNFNDDINKLLCDFGIDFKDKEELFEKLNILEKEISTCITDIKEQVEKTEKNKIEELKTIKKEAVDNGDIEL